MENRVNHPPRWADRFLEWYCREDLLEEIQGDLYELFSIRSVEQGPVRAALRYFWDVLRFFRLSNIRSVKTQNNTSMTINYFKTGWRQLKTQRTTTFINISGLALAIGFAITVFVFQDYFTNLDHFHTNRDRIYQILNHVEGDDETLLWSDIPFPVADVLTNKAPGVEFVTMIEFGEANIRYKKDVFRELVWYVTPDYLQMFDFPIKYGTKSALEDKNSIVISRGMAQKYFGRDDVVGEALHLKLHEDVLTSLTISAVMDDFPDGASFGGEFLLHVDNLQNIPGYETLDWTTLTDGIFFQLQENADLSGVEAHFSEMIALQNEASERWTTTMFENAPLPDLSVRNMEIRGSIPGGAHPSGRKSLTIMAILLLMLACFNYVNIAVSSATRRLKEIALRKVMGGQRTQIVKQFLTENFLICTIALLIGLMICYFFLLPGFNSALPIYIPFVFSSIQTAIIFFVSLVLIVTVASGAYPAFYISRFKPVTIFRGKQKFGSRQILSKVLMVFQLLIAFSTIVACFVFNHNAIQLANRDWGYEPEDVVAVPVLKPEQATQMAAAVEQWSDVEITETGYGHVGDYNLLTQLEKEDLTVNTFHYYVGAEYADVMGLRIKEGRWFTEEDESGAKSAVISEKLVSKLNLENPLEETLTYDSTTYQIVGVVEDFYQQIFYLEMMPVMFTAANPDEVNYLTVKAAPGKGREVDGKLAELWHTVAPNDPYEGFEQLEVMDEFYTENEANVIILTTISMFALFLACIGLYGLVSFQVSRRMKEISVRKVLGASMGHLTKVINRDYFWMLGIAMILGMPMGYLMIDQLIQAIYPDPEPTSILPFIASITILGLATLGTLGSQLWRVQHKNPADVLRSE